jgi:hypothetical protein
MLFLHDLKIAVRSLWRERALWFTVALTLAFGYRRQRRHLQRGSCCAAASLGQPG